MPVHPQGERRWALPAAGGSTSLTRLWRTVGPGALAPDLAKPLLAAATAALQGSGPSVAASEWEDAPAALRDARAVLGRCGPAHPDVDVVATAALALALRGEKGCRDVPRRCARPSRRRRDGRTAPCPVRLCVAVPGGT